MSLILITDPAPGPNPIADPMADPPKGYRVALLDAAGDPIAEPRPIVAVAAPFLDRYLGPGWHGADRPILLLLPYPGEDNSIPGTPPLRYTSESIGYIQVRIALGGHWFYRHPHGVAEVLGPGVRAWVDSLPEPAAVHAYRIEGPNLDRLTQVAAPIPAGVTEVTPYAAGEGPGFRIRPIPPAPPPPLTLDALGAAAPDPAFGTDPRHTDFIKVVMEPTVAAALGGARPFSDQVEEGGFLVGEVFADAAVPGTYILLIAAAVPAEEVGASFLHFTFTGDSFDRIKQRLASEHRGQQLLGWYHTHLFPATDAIGLSSIDYRLHFTTFRIPWQVAGLLNLDGGPDHPGRTLRYYVRRGDAMLLCHHQTRAAGRPDGTPDAKARPAPSPPVGEDWGGGSERLALDGRTEAPDTDPATP